MWKNWTGGGVTEASRPTKMLKPTFSWIRSWQHDELLVLMEEQGYRPSVFMKTKILEPEQMDALVKALNETMAPFFAYEVYDDK